jgi:hypothetical protein
MKFFHFLDEDPQTHLNPDPQNSGKHAEASLLSIMPMFKGTASHDEYFSEGLKNILSAGSFYIFGALLVRKLNT